jgi:RimJ/RimL family protein N-acetyltransferase
MPSDTVTGQRYLRLKPFRQRFASVVARWVQTPEELRLVAPGTEPPLTAAKVGRWKKPAGQALVLVRDGEGEPIGYGELNPMRSDRTHLWLGHVVLSPRERGNGIGQAFVRALVSYAFERLTANRISLIVFPDNQPALRCYRRVGFEDVGEEYHDFLTRGQKHRFLRLEVRPPLPDPRGSHANQPVVVC